MTPLGLSVGHHTLSPVHGAEQKEPSMAAIELEISSAKQRPRAGLRRVWGVSVRERWREGPCSIRESHSCVLLVVGERVGV